MKCRLNYPEFRELVQGYDIFCVSETKIDKHDIISLQGFTFLSQCRKQRFIRKSGGIGVFIKDELFPYVSFIESESDYILWFKFDKVLLKTDEDVVFGVVYLPPADSRFNTQDELDLFEVEITNMCILYKYVILTGDFNARTQTQDDFLDVDNFFADHFNFDDTLKEFYNISAMLSQFNMDKNRSSKDKTANNEGRILLETCKSNNLFILNGRCGKDKGVGTFTFKNISVIDYSIVTVQSLKFISDFEIAELDSIYTDNHSLLTTTLKFDRIKPKAKLTKNNTLQKRPKWQENKKTEFICNLNSKKIDEVHLYLQHARENIANINKENINNICLKISEIFTESAENSFTKSDTYSYSDTNYHQKRWFGFQCQSARKKYHLMRKVNHLNPSRTNKANLKHASQCYKRTINFHLNKFNQSMQNKLRNMKRKTPKEFWKIINSIERKNDEQNITLESLYDFFKDLNEKNDYDNDNSEINIDVTDDDEILNSS